MKKNSKRRLFNTMIIICLIVLSVVLFSLYGNYQTDREDENHFEELAKIVDTTECDGSEGICYLTDENPDCIGWLKVKGTTIDYPIMQTKEQPEYYLRRNFKKEYSSMGTPFLDANCDIDTSRNLIIYGHNMRTGTMFAPLMKYKSADYCKSHSEFELKTNTGTRTYKLFAILKVRYDDEWYSYTEQHGKIHFDNLITKIRSKAIYVSDEQILYGDYFITLSTCEYSQSNGRLIVIAKEQI